jgi:hypothetical protein
MLPKTQPCVACPTFERNFNPLPDKTAKDRQSESTLLLANYERKLTIVL